MQGHRRKICFTWEIQWLTLRKDPARDRKSKVSPAVKQCRMKTEQDCPQNMKPYLPLG